MGDALRDGFSDAGSIPARSIADRHGDFAFSGVSFVLSVCANDTF